MVFFLDPITAASVKRSVVTISVAVTRPWKPRVLQLLLESRGKSFARCVVGERGHFQYE